MICIPESDLIEMIITFILHSSMCLVTCMHACRMVYVDDLQE